MATRVFLFSGAAGAATFAEIPTIDGADQLQPPAGLTWTLREIRAALSAAGEWRIMFDTEKYYNGRQEIDFLAKGVPHTVALEIQQPHYITVEASGDAPGVTAKLELVIEEAPTQAGVA